MLDPSRIHGAGTGAAIGGVAGAAAEPVLAGARGLWNVTGRKVLDAMRGPVTVGAPAAADSDMLASALGGNAGGPSAFDASAGVQVTPSSSVADLADALAIRARAPSVSVPRSAADAAYDRVHQAIVRSGQTPAEALAQVQRLGSWGMLADTGEPLRDLARVVADAPGAGGQIAKDALNLRQSGVLEDGQWTVRPAALRVGDTLGQSLGVSDRTAAGDTEALLAAQKASAGPAYAKAYSADPVALSDLQDFSGSPLFRQAYDRARTISQRAFVRMPDGSEQIQPLPESLNLGRPGDQASTPPLTTDPAIFDQALSDVRTYGSGQSGDLFSAIKARGGVRVKDANGGRYLVGPDMDQLAVRRPGVINNRSGMTPEQMAEALHEDGWFGHGIEDPSNAFESAFNDQAGGRSVYHPNTREVGYNFNRDAFEQEASAAGVSANDPPRVAAQKLADHRSGDLAEREAIQWEGNLNDPDGLEFDRLAAPRGQTLDWRTLDLMKQGLDDQIREGRVQGIGANEQAATKGYLARFVDKLDSLNPHYATARAAFAGPAKLMDALEAGRSYMSEDAPTTAAAMAAYSPSEQEAFRVGAFQAERDRLGSVAVTQNAAARAGVSTPGRLAKLQQLFPDAESYGDYVNRLQAEDTMFGTRSRVLGGSATSRNLAHEADAGHNPLELAAEAGELVHNPIGGGLRLLGRALWSGGNGQGLTEPVADATAGLLFNSHPDAFPDFSAGLTEAARRAELARVLAGRMQPAASAGALGLADVLSQKRP